MKNVIKILLIVFILFIASFLFLEGVFDFSRDFLNLIKYPKEDEFFSAREYFFLEPKEIIKYTNKEREKRGLDSLSENTFLNISAEFKAEDMKEEQYFSHYSASGKGLSYYIQKSGYEGSVLGENLAMGNFKNEETLVNHWMESSSHRSNILNPKYNEIGVFIVRGDFNGLSTLFIAQHFGSSIKN